MSFLKIKIFYLMIISMFFYSESFSKNLIIGDKAPDFTLKNDLDQNSSLHDFIKKKVVLYFYPKDNTPGCTKEACSLRNNYKIFQENNIEVLGISYDSVESHKKFKSEHRLPFLLLSDENKEVAQLYGVSSTWLFFFTAPIPQRITFLIDEKGFIISIMKDIDVLNHAHDILKEFGL